MGTPEEEDGQAPDSGVVIREHGRAEFRLNKEAWRGVAWLALTVAAACAGGMAAIAALKHADGLAALALVLAIIAFLTQFVIYEAQSRASNSAEARSLELFGRTREALQDIQSTSAANQRVLVRQFDALLEVVVELARTGREVARLERPAESHEEEPAAEPAQGGLPEATPTRAAEVPEEEMRYDSGALARALARLQDLLGNEEGARWSPASSEYRRIARELVTWPSVEEARKGVEVLRALSPMAIALVRRYGDVEADSLREGRPPIVRRSPGRDEDRAELEAAGLMFDVGYGASALTEDGRLAARLLRARGDPPPEIDEILRTLRPNGR